MNHNFLLPTARYWDYRTGEPLYVHPLLGRVLAEVDGMGCYKIEASGDGLIVETDGMEFCDMSGSFREYIRVRSHHPLAASIQILTAEPYQHRGEPIQLPYTGRGWLISAATEVQVDGSHQALAAEKLAWPVPFHLGIGGEGTAVIAQCGDAAKPFCCVDLNRPQTLSESGFRVQNVSEVLSLNSTFADGMAYEAKVASHLNSASFKCSIPTGCNGLLLRKTYDRFHGRQRARVLVDGIPTGWWYEPFEDRTHRWGVGFYGIECKHLVGKEEITISIDPPAGAPLWSFSSLEVFSL